MFTGAITALVTPMKEHGVDEAAFAAFVDWQIGQGIHGLVPVGTTGESPTLSHDEHKRVVEICIEVAAGRVPVIAGAGSNNTEEAIDLAKHAEKAGADGLLIVTPYYNKPSQKGLHAHFAAIAAGVALPILIYNIPGRSVIDMSVETMARLFDECANITGVKDATAQVDRVSLQRAAMGPDFNQLSGEDSTGLGFMAHGGHGCISVTANVAPQKVACFYTACLDSDYRTALSLQDQLMPLHRALFLEPNPTGVKFLLSVMDKMANKLRLPLTPVQPETEKQILDAARHAGLLN